MDWQSISQNQEPPEGWPRPPKFNEPGDVPGPPVQFGEAITNNNVRAGYGFIPNGVEEKNLYFYHPDHLGSSSYITNKDGEVIQHTEYIAFGETFVDEHSVSKTMPYLFNAKELDYETGLYYYGARYYDAKTSLWLNVDPLAEKTGTPYAYTYNNPIRFIDPTGMEAEEGPGKPRRVTIYKHTVVWNDQAKRYAIYRVGETTGTRVEGIDWKGAEEYHYTVFVKDTNKTRVFSDNESFQKSFPNNFNHDAYKAELEGYDKINLVFNLGGDAFGLGGLKSKTLGKLSGHLQVAGLLTSGMKITAALKYNDKQTAKEEFKNTTLGWVVDKGLDKFNTVKDGVGEIFKIGKNQIQQILQNDKDRVEEKRMQKYKR